MFLSAYSSKRSAASSSATIARVHEADPLRMPEADCAAPPSLLSTGPAQPPLALRWREAAILGSLWAASEIVLGSFLHNLKVPLRGHILTAIGVVLLVAGHRRWGQRGLLWRAGLIAAAMKSASPSAVLLGPMVAIAMEGFALELATRLAPRRLTGYLLGGALAMSWTMTHRILALLMAYGANIVTVYTRLVAFAEAQLGHLPLGAWGPIVGLVAINLAFGAAAAAVGWGVAAAPPLVEPEAPSAATPARHGQVPVGRSGAAARRGAAPSLLALALVIVALPAGMFALGKLPLAGGAAVVAAVALVAAWRYPSTMRRLRRPGFWVGLVLLTAIAAIVFAAGAPAGGARWGGVLIGAAMSLRAVFVALSFAALGTELANPVIRAWMGRHGAAPFLAALETAFVALPEAIAAVPPPRTLLRHPRRAVGSLLPHLERWLARTPAG